MKALTGILLAVIATGAIATETDPAMCQLLRDRIKYIEALERRGSTPNLAEQKRDAQEKMSQLNCPGMDPSRH